MQRLSQLLLLIGAALPVFAQASDDLTAEYLHAMPAAHANTVFQVFLAVLYLLLYGAAIVTTMSSLKIFGGMDAELVTWIIGVWLGGMGLSWLTHHIMPHPAAVLVTMPLLFGLTFFVSTRSWADLSTDHGWRVALVVALVCAPYFGPSFH
jgi:hypothetical protein